MDERKFDQLVQDYFKAESKYVEAKSLLDFHAKNLPCPERPSHIENIEDWNRYEQAYQEYKAQIDVDKQSVDWAKKSYEARELALVNFLPRGVWFKIGELAIGSAFYDWGGPHYSIVTETWSDHLSSLNRRHKGD